MAAVTVTQEAASAATIITHVATGHRQHHAVTTPSQKIASQ